MKQRRFIVLFFALALIFASLAFVAFTQDTAEDTSHIFQADPDNYQPCGAYTNYRRIEPPAAASPAPSNTPDPSAATATPAPATATPRPAPSEDRVGFPENWATDFNLLLVFDRADRRWVRVICGNDIASQRQAGEDFAYGSVLLMISYTAKLDTNGQPVLDENGHYIGENLVAMHVQRKEEGFGEAYGAERSGEWEFMGYWLDGSIQTAPHNTNACANCHLTEAGEDVDFVFRMDAPLLGEAEENEVSIHLYGFHEPVLEIRAGTTVTWVNNDEARHTVVAAVLNEAGRVVAADDPLFASNPLASVTIEAGASFSFTFDEPGEYLYRCTIHENMVGRIIVTE